MLHSKGHMCNEFISNESGTSLMKLNSELVQTAFQAIYEHLQREAVVWGSGPYFVSASQGMR